MINQLLQTSLFGVPSEQYTCANSVPDGNPEYIHVRVFPF